MNEKPSKEEAGAGARDMKRPPKPITAGGALRQACTGRPCLPTSEARDEDLKAGMEGAVAPEAGKPIKGEGEPTTQEKLDRPWSEAARVSRGRGRLSELPPSPPGGGVGHPSGPVQVLATGSRFDLLEVEEAADGDPDLEAKGPGVEEPPRYRRHRRKKAFGSASAHARFLQHVFRRTTARRPGCWRRGGMRGLSWWRPPTVFGCNGGLDLAAESDFRMQREASEAVLAWYGQYVLLHRRLHSGFTPTAVVTFSGQGGTSEGIRRAGGASHGQDLRDQPRYRGWFGDNRFSQGDSTNPTVVRELARKTKAFIVMGSPPCQPYSTTRVRGVVTERALIEETRSLHSELRQMGDSVSLR